MKVITAARPINDIIQQDKDEYSSILDFPLLYPYHGCILDHQKRVVIKSAMNPPPRKRIDSNANNFLLPVNISMTFMLLGNQISVMIYCKLIHLSYVIFISHVLFFQLIKLIN